MEVWAVKHCKDDIRKSCLHSENLKQIFPQPTRHYTTVSISIEKVNMVGILYLCSEKLKCPYTL